MPMKLSEMRQVLEERGIQLTKSLGQNFLHDGNQLGRIVAQAGLEARDRVLEVGPGLGPLTAALLERAGEVLAIEKDRRLVAVLRERFAGKRGLTLVHDDALEFLRRERRGWAGWKLVSNLPYSVGSPILVELAQSDPGPELMVATLQIEVAKRLMARPGEEDYGLLTLLVQLAYEGRGWFKIPAACFFPEPEVDSACVTLARRKVALLPEPGLRAGFSRVVKRAFSQRRKMMAKLLKEDWREGWVEAAFAEAGLSRQVRAEAVTLEEFVRLTRALHGLAGKKETE